MIAALVGVLALAVPPRASAHTIPDDATVQVFIKPSGERLQLLIRVPLLSMQETEFPQTDKGLLDLSQANPALQEAAKVWISDAIEMDEGSARLPDPQIVKARISLPSDGAFNIYDDALSHLNSPPLPPDTQVYWSQSVEDVELDYPIQSDRSDFSIHPLFANLALHVVTVLHFLPPGGADHAFALLDDPGLVRLDPRWTQAALQFVHMGFLHILSGTDHLLFLFCLVIPFRKFRALIPIVTSFTVAHSITLICSAYNLAPDALWFPPLIEFLIAVSILYMALENIVGTASVNRRWMITFGFGLVHGFGFSFALRQTLQFAGSHLLTSLLSFNIGVELGQLFVLALMIPALDLLFRYVVAERMGTIILSAFVAHTAWHWGADRWDTLSRFPFQWPAFEAAPLAMALRLLTIIAIFAALLWLIFGVLIPRGGSGAEKPPTKAVPSAEELQAPATEP